MKKNPYTANISVTNIESNERYIDVLMKTIYDENNKLMWIQIINAPQTMINIIDNFEKVFLPNIYMKESNFIKNVFDINNTIFERFDGLNTSCPSFVLPKRLTQEKKEYNDNTYNHEIEFKNLMQIDYANSLNWATIEVCNVSSLFEKLQRLMNITKYF
jgi:hypothetical protein